MNKREFLNIDIPSNIDESIDIGIERATIEMDKIKFKRNRITKIAVVASLSLIFILGVSNPAFASKIPIVGSVFELIEENLHYSGNFSKYATSINETVSNNGVDITIAEVLCDGEGLYVTYKVKSEEAFKFTSVESGDIDIKQLLTEEEYSKVSFSDKGLVSIGFSGLEGEFIDEHTFVGMERYYLSVIEEVIPEKFDLQIKLTSIGTRSRSDRSDKQELKGTWEFKVPVTVDKTISKRIDVNYKNEQGYSLDSILITPVEVVVDITNPKDKGCFVRVVDDKNNAIAAELIMNEADGNTTYFTSIPDDSKNIKVILYGNKMVEKETVKYPDGSCETEYENIGEEIYLEKVIELN
ncbi:MAG: DUF4179 domain-containing protein [Clostridium sp.]